MGFEREEDCLGFLEKGLRTTGSWRSRYPRSKIIQHGFVGENGFSVYTQKMEVYGKRFLNLNTEGEEA